MKLTITELTQTTTETWLDFWQHCPWATVPESPDWFNLWVSCLDTNARTHPLLVTFSDGVQCVIPALRVGRVRNLVEVLQAGPSGGYGGPLSRDVLTGSHLTLILDRIRREHADFHLRINPFLLHRIQPDLNSVTCTILPTPVRADFTQPVPLDSHTEDLLSRKRVRRYARSASANGFQVKVMPAEEIDEYIQTYTEAKVRWKEATVDYPDRFFKAMVNLTDCTFFGVYDDEGNYCGGGPILTGGTIVTTWLSVMRNNRLKSHIYELFYYELVHRFRSEGYAWFDFNPSSGKAGVIRFKRNFTPYTLPAPEYEGYSWKRLALIALGRP